MKPWQVLAIAVPVLIGIIVFINWPAIKEKIAEAKGGEGAAGNGGTSGGSGSGGSSSSGLNNNKVLKNGTRGEEEKALQRMMNSVEKSNPLVVDGIMGPLSVAKLQRITGKTSITLAQAATWYAVYNPVKKSKSDTENLWLYLLSGFQ